MAVTINTIGPNSRQIVIEDEFSPLNIIDAITSSLVSLGQTLYDTVSSGALNCLVTKVYSAPNNDGDTTGGPSTKYMILRFDGPRQLWNVSCCEYWDAVSHTATNECFTNGKSVVLPLQYNYCWIYVFASPRYAAFTGVVLAEPSAQQGVFEFERVATEDTAANGIPCFGWTSSLNIGEAWSGTNISTGLSTTQGSIPCVFSVPRTVTGYTGFNAHKSYIINTSLGNYPPSTNTVPLYAATGGLSMTASPLHYHNGMLGGFTYNYQWDTNKKVISSLRLDGHADAQPRGRVYGLSVVPSVGNFLDTASIPIDSNYFFDTTGTMSPHFLLNINGGYIDTIGITTNKISTTLITSMSTQICREFLIIRGRQLYLSSTTGNMYKYDLVSDGYTNILNTANTWDMVFDGNRYIYAVSSSTTNTINRIDITDDSVTTLGLGVAALACAIDDNYLYVTTSTATTSPKVAVINLSTFTVSKTYTAPVYSAAHDFKSVITDYSGYAYASSPSGTPSATNDIRLHKISGSSEDSTVLVLTSTNAGTSSCCGSMVYDGEHIIYHTGTTTGVFKIVGILPNMTIDLAASSSTLAANGSNVTGYNIKPVPLKGYYTWATGYNSPAGSTIIHPHKLNHYSATTMVVGSVLVAIGATALSSYFTVIKTDGCNLYAIGTNLSQLVKSSNLYGPYNNNGYRTANLLIKA